MFYHLLYPLPEHWSAFNVFKYITFRAAYATVTALLICFIFGDWVIRRSSAADRRDDPRRRARSTTRPRPARRPWAACWCWRPSSCRPCCGRDLTNRYVQLALLGTVWMGLIGFIDDYLKVVKKRPKGMIGRFKLAGQVGYGLMLGSTLVLGLAGEPLTITSVPFLKDVGHQLGLVLHPAGDPGRDRHQQRGEPSRRSRRPGHRPFSAWPSAASRCWPT